MKNLTNLRTKIADVLLSDAHAGRPSCRSVSDLMSGLHRTVDCGDGAVVELCLRVRRPGLKTPSIFKSRVGGRLFFLAFKT